MTQFEKGGDKCIEKRPGDPPLGFLLGGRNSPQTGEASPLPCVGPTHSAWSPFPEGLFVSCLQVVDVGERPARSSRAFP